MEIRSFDKCGRIEVYKSCGRRKNNGGVVCLLSLTHTTNIVCDCLSLECLVKLMEVVLIT